MAGCAAYTENASYLYGERYHVAKINTYPTRVTEIDGRSTFNRQNQIPVEPRRHLLSLMTAPAAWFGVSECRNPELEIEACRRYYIVAERDIRPRQNWRPVIDYVTRLRGPDRN